MISVLKPDNGTLKIAPRKRCPSKQQLEKRALSLLTSGEAQVVIFSRMERDFSTDDPPAMDLILLRTRDVFIVSLSDCNLFSK
jgi:hypothetical protein